MHCCTIKYRIQKISITCLIFFLIKQQTLEPPREVWNYSETIISYMAPNRTIETEQKYSITIKHHSIGTYTTKQSRRNRRATIFRSLCDSFYWYFIFLYYILRNFTSLYVHVAYIINIFSVPTKSPYKSIVFQFFCTLLIKSYV